MAKFLQNAWENTTKAVSASSSKLKRSAIHSIGVVDDWARNRADKTRAAFDIARLYKNTIIDNPLGNQVAAEALWAGTRDVPPDQISPWKFGRYGAQVVRQKEFNPDYLDLYRKTVSHKSITNWPLLFWLARKDQHGKKNIIKVTGEGIRIVRTLSEDKKKAVTELVESGYAETFGSRKKVHLLTAGKETAAHPYTFSINVDGIDVTYAARWSNLFVQERELRPRTYVVSDMHLGHIPDNGIAGLTTFERKIVAKSAAKEIMEIYSKHRSDETPGKFIYHLSEVFSKKYPELYGNDPNALRFVELFKKIISESWNNGKKTELVLNGDFFDLYEGKLKSMLKLYAFVPELNRILSDNGVRVTYVPGNHDIESVADRKAFEQLYTDIAYPSLLRGQTLITHGHSQGNPKSLDFEGYADHDGLADEKGTSVNKQVFKLRRIMKAKKLPFVGSTVNGVLRTLVKDVNLRELVYVDQAFAEMANNISSESGKQIDAVIYGHFHTPTRVNSEHGPLLINSPASGLTMKGHPYKGLLLVENNPDGTVVRQFAYNIDNKLQLEDVSYLIKPLVVSVPVKSAA